MKPRAFLDFFKTRSGKLVVFAAVFGGGLVVFSTLRDPSGAEDIQVTQLTPNATDRPQVVQSIERPMQAFRPPAPKPEPPPPPPKSHEPPKIVVEKPKPEPPPQPLPSLSLFADASAGVPEPKTPGSIYAPFGRLIRDVRSGKVRILFGSTQKMGSGTNVQERLIALHHLDAPWRPADVEQREGRILRQGNKNAVVSVFRYVVTSPKAPSTPTCGRPWRRRPSSSPK